MTCNERYINFEKSSFQILLLTVSFKPKKDSKTFVKRFNFKFHKISNYSFLFVRNKKSVTFNYINMRFCSRLV